MKITKGIKTNEGERFIIIQCNCGETLRFPFDAEYLKCPECGALGSKKMLIEYFKNIQQKANDKS